MAKHATYSRSPWQDRFKRPTAHDLRFGLGSRQAQAFDRIRVRLLELAGVREHYAWHGDCWKWTVEYRTSHSELPLAVIVPCPNDLQVAVPLDREFASSLPVRRMKRAVRDGLDLAQEPFNTNWAVWSVVSVGLLDDLQDLIERKLQYLAKRAG
jgi:hypothetical protein